MLPPGQIDLDVETNLIDALLWGGDTDAALRRAESLASRARAIGAAVGELCGLIMAGHVRLFVAPEGIADPLEELIRRALPVFQAADDRVALHVAYFTLAWVKQLRGRVGEGLDAVERAVEYRPERVGELLAWRGGARLDGPTPVADLLAWLDEPEQRQLEDPWLDSYRAQALAMLGRVGEARAIMAESRAVSAERRGRLELAALIGQQSAEIELLAGDPVAAADLATEGCRQLESLGEHYFQTPMLARLARILCTLDRLDDADELVERVRRMGASDDGEVGCRWRQAKAVVLARRGRHAEAEELARAAVAIAETTDILNNRADAYADLAEVLLLGDKAGEAAAALEQALDRYERKGNLVMAGRTRNRLAALAAQR